MLRATAALVGALALGFVLLSVIAAFTIPAAAQERVLRIGLREDPDPLDPTLGSS
jgi:hypothetical protein